MLLIILISVAILCCLLLWSLSSPFYWKRKGVPYLIPLPLFGSNFSSLRMSLAEFYIKLYNNYPNERFFGFHYFMKPTLLLKDPKLIKEILVKDFEYFTWNGFYSNQDHDPFGSNLFFLHGQAWKEIRTKLTTIFTPSKLRPVEDYVDSCMIKVNKCIQEKFVNKEPVEIDKITVGIAVDVIMQALFGIETDSFEKNSQFVALAKDMFDNTVNAKFILGLISPDLSDFFKINIYNKIVNDLVKDILENTIKYRETNRVDNNDFLGTMMKLMKENKNTIREKFYPDKTRIPEYNFKTALAQAMILIAGGAESSAMAMAFFMYEASLNQEIQEKCRAEIMAVVNETGRNIRPEDIGRLPYVNMAMNETLRKYPPFISITRKCTKKYTFTDTNLTIEPGTLLLAPVKSIHWDPKNYPNPEAFIPERFADKSAGDAGAFLTWGLGPRTCLGKNLAKLEMILAVTRLLRNYRFTISSKTKVPIKLCPYTAVLTPDPAIWLDVQPIEDGSSNLT